MHDLIAYAILREIERQRFEDDLRGRPTVRRDVPARPARDVARRARRLGLTARSTT